MRRGTLELAGRLCRAVRAQEERTVEDLLQQGADPNLILPEGIAAIHLAAGVEQESGTRCLSLILQYGGNPSVRSIDDITPLHVAASWGCCTCLRLLLISGGDPTLKDQDGNTAIDLALEHENEMCVRILHRYLEEPGKEQNLWFQQRQAESFLTSLTEDLQSTGTSTLSEDEPPDQFNRGFKSSPNETLQYVKPDTFSSSCSAAVNYCIPGDSQLRCGIENLMSSSLLTEDSLGNSTFCNHCNLSDDLELPSRTSFSFANRYRNLATDQTVMQPNEELEPSKAEAQSGTTQSHYIKSTTNDGCSSSGLNITFPTAPPTDFPLQKPRANPKEPNTRGSPTTCAIQDQCKADFLPRTQDPDATVDLSHYSSFLVPDLMVKVTAQEGLDVTSPDHAYVFCRANSTAMLDLDKTVVDTALLSKLHRDSDEHDVKSKLDSSNGESSSLYNTAVLDAVPSVIGEQTSNNKSQHKSSRSMPLETGTEFNKKERGNGQELEDMEEKRGNLITQDTVSILSTCALSGGESSDTMTVPDDSFRAREEEFTDLDVKLRRMMLSTKVFHSPVLQTGQGTCHVTPRTKSRLTASSTCSSDGTELNKKERRGSGQKFEDMEEKEGNLMTHDTEPIQSMDIFSGGESSDTMVVQQGNFSAREEKSTDLDVELRGMMLSTKVFHSPVLQTEKKPCHVTPRTKSRMASSTSNSDGSSLFDESLDIPVRHRRVRSPMGTTPVSCKVKDRAVDRQNESSPWHAEEEFDSLEDTLLIAAVPNDCRQSSCPNSGSLGIVTTSPAPLANSGREVCIDKGQEDVCCTGMEVACHLDEVRCLSENNEEVCTAEVTSDAVTALSKPESSISRCSRVNPSRVSFSKLPAGELPGVQGISSCPSGSVSPISQNVSLSPGGRPLSLNTTEPVEYLYVDEDIGHALVERHLPCIDDSIASTTSSEDTVIYDWRTYANQVDRQSSKESSPIHPSTEVRLLSDEALLKKLRDFGVNPGPITELTRIVYMKLLEKLISDPKSKARKGSAGYSPELCSVLETYQIPDSKDDEMTLAYQFDQPDKSKKWREGLLKSSFNYLLLDPRVTQNLPFRCQYTSQAECFRTFINAIFYVGKGKRSRPYSHLYEALTHYKKNWRTQNSQVCSKVQHILEIWSSGQGVISMHCFQNVIPVEAYTREACMVDAIGLKMLTNQKRGNYYGVVANWPMRRRRCLGVHLLHRAMQIFLAEGERQLRPTDIR